MKEITEALCSRCKQKKSIEQLNGYDFLAPEKEQYLNAYCRDLATCDSSESKAVIDNILSALED